MAAPASIALLGMPPDLDEGIRQRLARAQGGWDIVSAADRDDFIRILEQQPSLIIALRASSWAAEQALQYLHQHELILPLIVVDPQPSQETMAKVLQQGAADYIGLNQLDRIEGAAIMAINRRVSRHHLLAASEVRYQTLVDTMQDGMMAVDTQGIITFVNPALSRMLGYQRDEMVGMDLRGLYDDKNWAILQRELAKRAQGLSSTYDAEVRAKDGHQIPTFISASPLMSEEGEWQGSMAVYTDLSDLRRAEAEVIKAAEEWRQCFDALEDLVMVIDNDMKVQRCNRAMRDYLGLNFKQIVGQPCYKVMHGLDSPPPHCLHRKMLHKSSVHSEDYQDPRTGQLFAVTVSPITDNTGAILGTVHLYKDITEHRRREKERVEMALELTRGLEATTMALTNMVDSRDPYTSGHSQRVAELAVQVGSQMGMSEDELTGLKYCGLLHDIGKGAIPLDILNKPGTLTEHERGIINEHPATAYRILENISFPWPVAKVVYQHHERIDGSGYPQGLKGEEIHPWARLLAVCDVVEAMTSHRPYRPAHGMNEAFQVLRDGAGQVFDEEIVQAALTGLSVDDRRVTVVDDDPGVLDVYSNFLRRGKYDIVSYNNPQEAVDGFAQNPTPILVTDLKMPGKSGLEVLQEIKKVKPDAEVIVVTGHGDKESVVAAMRMGASDFLEKPVQMAELQQAVDRARERYTRGS